MPAWKNDKAKKNQWCTSFYYTDWTGAKKAKTKRGFARKKDASDWEGVFLAKFSQSPSIKLKTLVDNYFEDIGRGKQKITSISGKKSRVQSKILPYLGEMALNTIESIHVLNWQNAIKDLGYEKNPGGYAETYLRTLNNDLSSLLNYAVQYYKLPSNPCKTAGNMGKSKADTMLIWTLDQFEQFIKYENKPALKLAFNILYWSGIREGELLALTPSDFSSSLRLNIDKNYAVVESEEHILSPKASKSIRNIAIPDFLYDEAIAYIDSLYGIAPDDRLFYFRKSTLLSEIKRVAKLAKLNQIRVHDLRHSHASLLIEMGFNILMISERLGHEKVETTWEVYAHLYPDKDKQIAFGLQAVKLDGITSNHSAENQVVSLLGEIKKYLPNYNTYESDSIILWNQVSKEKQIIGRDTFNQKIQIFTDPKEAFVKMMSDGFYCLNKEFIFCFSSRGMPVEYL